MRLKKKVAQLIGRERVCRVATVNEDGMPHLVPSVDNIEPVLGHGGPRRHCHSADELWRLAPILSERA